MVLRLKYSKRNTVILVMAAAVYLLNVMCTTLSHHSHYTHATGGDQMKFAGSASCAGCHRDIYESHIKTAHYTDSRPASKEFIKGSFQGGRNKFVFNQFSSVTLEKRKNGFFQVAYMNDSEYMRKPFDIVIGSGRKGQTYLYWEDDLLFQLPVSYYTPMNSWCNSPGFPSNYPRFDRRTTAQCLECHGTYAQAKEEVAVNAFDKSTIIYGIDCERCHGPAAEHVAFHQQHPDDKTGRYITNAKKLDRQARLDGCALCHSGFRNAIKPAFSFAVGDKLDEFSSVRYNMDSVSTLDVHGNQYGLLTASKCFKASQMDCSSCHDVHKNEFNSPKIFSQRCMNCHNNNNHDTCTVKPPAGVVLSNNCIDCHMPALPSGKIKLEVATAGKMVPDLVRTHRIAVYR
jgi:Cytochrome c554 and c-prime